MPNRISERDFVARHSFQRLNTTEVAAEPALSGANVPAADVDNDGAIQGEPELENLYAKLLALDASASPTTGVDLDAPSVRPQTTGTEASLGNRQLGDVAALRAVRDGATVLARISGVTQLGVGSVQDALLVVAAAEETRRLRRAQASRCGRHRAPSVAASSTCNGRRERTAARSCTARSTTATWART